MTDIVIEPGSLKNFFIRVNTDAKYRLNFLLDPVGILREAGIEIDKAAEEEVRNITKMLVETLPTLANIPTGYGVVLLNVQAGNPPGPPSHKNEELLLQ